MPCLLALFALLTPRIVIVLLWFFSHWFNGVFQHLTSHVPGMPVVAWPILGFLFLPTTTLWYSAVVHWYGGHWTLVPMIGLLIALLIDISPASSRRRRWRRN